MEDQLKYSRLGLLWTAIPAFLMILFSVACLCRRFRQRTRMLDSFQGSETDKLLDTTQGARSNESYATGSNHPVFMAKLSIDDLSDVIKKVWKARASWRDLGIQLGLAIDQLAWMSWNKTTLTTLTVVFKK